MDLIRKSCLCAIFMLLSGFPSQPHAGAWLACTMCCGKAFARLHIKYICLLWISQRAGCCPPLNYLAASPSWRMGFPGLCLGGRVNVEGITFPLRERLPRHRPACLPASPGAESHSALLLLHSAPAPRRGSLSVPREDFFARSASEEHQLDRRASSLPLPCDEALGQGRECYFELFRHVVIHRACRL